ncbi:hypothetical protein [Paenibacillus hamazuiensis]|uniref:hypothetical protein n=1 Tax=Paenibacillus hamazuiensis TaxID=2936508 RepID=UPI00200E8191|nr:hypothetical protein [Paenibacillus hamazuiensis]
MMPKLKESRKTGLSPRPLADGKSSSPLRPERHRLPRSDWPQPSSILQLQQTAGNQAVIQMLYGHALRQSPAETSGGSAPIQMVHPAFNSVNFWRPQVMNENGEYADHPLSPEGQKKRLTDTCGTAIMKLLLYTDLPEDEAARREFLTLNFLDKGGTREDALEILKENPLDNATLKKGFEQKRLTDAFGKAIMKELLNANLSEEEANEREGMVAYFLKRGVSRHDVHEILKLNISDNETIYRMLQNRLISADDSFLSYSPEEAESAEVKSLMRGMREESEEALFRHFSKTKELSKESHVVAEMLKPSLIAIDLELKERRLAKRKAYSKLNGGINNEGMVIEFYGPESEKNNKKWLGWMNRIMSALFGASFLRSRRPPLHIKIMIRAGVHSDVALTFGHDELVSISIDRYQLDEFSVGQMLGLLTHELGVHSLDATSLSEEELAAEAADKDKRQTGMIGNVKYTVGKVAGIEGQQDDHLTIGRAVLGQLSAAPRLHIYEQTLVSVIDVLDQSEERKEVAAAYCIDIARIVVTNDGEKRLGITAIKLMPKIISAALAEWQRIVSKYGGTHPDLRNIDMSGYYIAECLTKLVRLFAKIKLYGTE